MRMVRCLLSALALALAHQAFLLQAEAQQQAYPGVALLDLKAVLEQHPGFQAVKKELQGAVEMAQVDFRARQERLAKLVQQLKQLKQGTPEFKNLEARVTKERADLNVYASLKRKELLERETKMYYNAYVEIRQIVAQICRQYNIGIVLRFDSKELDPNNSQQVLQRLNNRIFYHQKALDLTPLVIQQLKQRAGAAAARPFVPQGGSRR